MVKVPARDQLEVIRRATQLAELASAFETDSIDELYFRAKSVWKEAVRRTQERAVPPDGLPGSTVDVASTTFHVHGITHAGTTAEREYFHPHVSAFLDRGAQIYCEQGIRQMFFDDLHDVCEMDDYRWAMTQCDELDADHHAVAVGPKTRIDRVRSDLETLTEGLLDATFSLIESGRPIYGERFERALGDVAADFATDPAALATGRSYEAFALSREVSKQPSRLVELQRYYERAFLPQPLEREWLRRHDPALELLTHARNERMADYAVYHATAGGDVHLLVGAAHQPGVGYYLDRYRRGRNVRETFEFV